MVTKKTYLGYYSISIKLEDNNSYFIEIFSTEKKPNEWEKIKICLFDSWHDDLIYQTTFDSSYLWIRVESKFGVGSITILPENFEDVDKDYLIVHDYSPKKDFNPVIGVFVHPNTPYRIEKVKDHINSLRGSNIPIYLCSNMGCPDELIDLCDGYIYTGPNDLCTVPEEIENKSEYLRYSIKNPLFLYPEKIPFYQEHSFINGRGTYLWSAANSLKKSIHSLEKMGFTHMMVSEGEFILDKKDFETPLEILKNMWQEEIVLDFFYTSGSRYLQAYLWFGEIDHLSKVFFGVSKGDKHFPRNSETSRANALILCEKYYQHKLLSFDPSKKIRVRSVKENFDNIKNRYWYTRRTEVILYEILDFKSDLYKTEEFFSFPLYFPNTREVFLSIAGDNTKSDSLDSGSFDLGVTETKEDELTIIAINKTRSKVLNFKMDLYHNSGEIVETREITRCSPGFFYFLVLEKPEGYSGSYGYSVFLTEGGETIYDGKIN